MKKYGIDFVGDYKKLRGEGKAQEGIGLYEMFQHLRSVIDKDYTPFADTPRTQTIIIETALLDAYNQPGGIRDEMVKILKVDDHQVSILPQVFYHKRGGTDVIVTVRIKYAGHCNRSRKPLLSGYFTGGDSPITVVLYNEGAKMVLNGSPNYRSAVEALAVEMRSVSEKMGYSWDRDIKYVFKKNTGVV